MSFEFEGKFILTSLIFVCALDLGAVYSGVVVSGLFCISG